MRAELERKRLTRVKILEGEAERLPIRDGCANGVIVAQVSASCYFLILGKTGRLV